MTRVPGSPLPERPESPADDHHGAGFLTVGNFLSLLRIPLGFMFLLVSEPKWVAAIVIAGAATDLLDGLIARLTHTESEIGALLDPFCDRIFVFLALVSFLPTGRIDWAEFLILILRDIFTGGSSGWAGWPARRCRSTRGWEGR